MIKRDFSIVFQLFYKISMAQRKISRLLIGCIRSMDRSARFDFMHYQFV